MSMKNNNNVNEPEELDPAEANSQDMESTPGKHEADASGVIQDQDAAIQPEVTGDEPDAEMSPDDLLEDVRHSLITETAEKEEADQSKWWKRIVKGARSKKGAVTPPPAEIELPADASSTGIAKQDEYVEQLDELIDMLEEKTQEESIDEQAHIVPPDEAIPAGEQKEQELVDVDELKKRAFSARTTPEEEDELSDVRSIALDDGEEVFVEVEVKAENQMRDRMKAFENALRPYRNYLYFGFVFIGLVAISILSMSIYRLYLQSLPPPPVEEVTDLPYPVAVNLPGGLRFNLGRGKLEDGRWNPRGPEWLAGTEVCRWIAIPYSRQMEAVVLTLKRDDRIELIMSNNDVLVYTVYSRDQLSIEEMQELDSDSPCMLLVLAQSDSDERWVVTALP